MATGLHPVALEVDAAKLSSTRTEKGLGPSRLVHGLELWHLLSLDAPTVAMLWTWLLARSNHISLPATSILAMGLAVWMLYATDRLLDARAIAQKAGTFFNAAVVPDAVREATAVILTLSLPKGRNLCISSYPPIAELQPRHYFHHRHRIGFCLGLLIAFIALVLLLPQLAPQSIRLYLVLGTVLCGYFIVIHAGTSASQRLPKELAVGVFFSAAIFIPSVARNPGLRLALIPGAALFAMLCSLNCLFIYVWEHPVAIPQTHPATAAALRFLPLLAASVATAGLILSCADHALPWPISIGCAGAALLLLLLHRHRWRFLPTTQRAAADLCLLTPLLLLPLLRS